MCQRDFEENWAFREKIGLLVKMSVRKRYFGENWAVGVKTGLIQKKVCQRT